MLSLMGHQSTIMLLSLLIIHPCKAVYKSFPFPGRLHRTQDPGCYPTPWESYEGRPTPPPPERAPPNDPTPPAVGLRQVLPPGTSKELTQGPDPPPPRLLQAKVWAPHFPAPGAERPFNTPVSPGAPSQKSQLGLEADGCLSPASILLPSGWWQAFGTTFPGLIPEYFSAHRKFFVTFPLL